MITPSKDNLDSHTILIIHRWPEISPCVRFIHLVEKGGVSFVISRGFKLSLYINYLNSSILIPTAPRGCSAFARYIRRDFPTFPFPYLLLFVIIFYY